MTRLSTIGRWGVVVFLTRAAHLSKTISLALAVLMTVVVSAELFNGVVRPPAASNAGLAGHRPLVLPPAVKFTPQPSASSPVAVGTPVPGEPGQLEPSATPAVSPVPTPMPALIGRPQVSPQPVGTPTPAPRIPRLAGPPSAGVSAATSVLFDCVWPLVGRKPLPVNLELALAAPNSTGIYPTAAITASIAFSSDLDDLFNTLDAATFSGTFRLMVPVSTPDGDLPVYMTLTLPKSTVPASGAFTVTATGTTPGLSFTHPGLVTYTIQSASLGITASDPAGNLITTPAMSPLSCGLDPTSNGSWLSFQAVSAV